MFDTDNPVEIHRYQPWTARLRGSRESAGRRCQNSGVNGKGLTTRTGWPATSRGCWLSPRRERSTHRPTTHTHTHRPLRRLTCRACVCSTPCRAYVGSKRRASFCNAAGWRTKTRIATAASTAVAAPIWYECILKTSSSATSLQKAMVALMIVKTHRKYKINTRLVEHSNVLRYIYI